MSKRSNGARKRKSVRARAKKLAQVIEVDGRIVGTIDQLELNRRQRGVQVPQGNFHSDAKRGKRRAAEKARFRKEHSDA